MAVEIDEKVKTRWQPIETAPRDETWVLTWDAESGHGLGRYCALFAMAECDPWSGATHWMPLPDPPTEAE